MSHFSDTLKELKKDIKIRQMRRYSQHGTNNSYNHSVYVAVTAYRLARHLHLHVNEKELARGALLHDFYLYDIEEEQLRSWHHGTRHAQIALDNAKLFYDLSPIEKDIIYSHMWPLNITHLPKTKEAFLVNFADKYCAFKEVQASKKKKKSR